MEKKYWDLIVKHFTEEILPAEEKELNEWIKQSTANAQMFKKVEKLLKLSKESFETYMPDTAKKWDKLKAKILVEPAHSQTRSVKAPRTYWLKMAAAVLLIAGLGYVLSTIEKEGPVTETIAYVEIEAIDSVSVFYLPDSTKIRLNKNSRFSYPEKFVGGIRGVNLSGEAFFEVTGDTANPFIVYAGNTQTRVLGTSFNVRAYEDEEDVEVAVVEGKVKFSSEDSKEEVILEVEEKATYNKERRTYKRDKGNANEFKWWLKDLGKDLEDAGEEIEEDVKRFFKRAKNKVKKK